MTHLQFSIIVPVYNRFELLEETIKSLTNQTYGDIEIILVDDGSSTSVADFLKGKNIDSRISIIRLNVNSGESAAVNQGWVHAKNRFRAIVNSDDPQEPTWLAQMSTAILANPEFGFFYPDRKVIDAKGAVIRAEPLHDWSKKLAYKKLIMIASAGLVIDSSKLPVDFLPRDENIRYPSDLEQMFRLIEYVNGYHVRGVYGVWREHSNSATSATNSISQFQDFEKYLLQWILRNEFILKKYTNIRFCYAYLYAQGWLILRAKLTVKESIIVLSKSRFKYTLTQYPSVCIYLLQISAINAGRKFLN